MINRFINYVKSWLSPPSMAVELDWSKHPDRMRQKIEQVSLDKPIERWRCACNFNGVSNWH